MTAPTSIPDPQQQLAAFADGELDGDQNLQVLRRLGQDPTAAGRVEAHQKLRRAVARVMAEPDGGAPEALRRKISQLATELPPGEGQSGPVRESRTGSPVLAVLGRWVPAAVAAVLFFGALVLFNAHRVQVTGAGDAAVNLITAANVLNPSVVDQFGDRHFKCSRHIAKMHGTDRFPQTLTQLPGALSEYFSQPIDPEALDLSSLGYEFEVAGVCLVPGQGAVHIVYESQPATGHTDALSLWMRPYEAGSGIQPDKLYASKATQETYPMIVWRHGDMVYYLVGDAYDTVERAFGIISRHRD